MPMVSGNAVPKAHPEANELSWEMLELQNHTWTSLLDGKRVEQRFLTNIIETYRTGGLVERPRFEASKLLR